MMEPVDYAAAAVLCVALVVFVSALCKIMKDFKSRK